MMGWVKGIGLGGYWVCGCGRGLMSGGLAEGRLLGGEKGVVEGPVDMVI